MKIIYGNIKEIKNIIQAKAKYQKVMLIYDDSVTNSMLADIYNEVKENCVFNQCFYKEIGEEINNGYKLILYVGSGDGFLEINYNRQEFTNVFYPTNSSLLPFFIYDNFIDTNESFIIMDRNWIDVNILSSYYFNRFYSYVSNLFKLENKDIEFDFTHKEITHGNLMNIIEQQCENVEFVDLEILTSEKIEYSHLGLLNLLLIDAFLVFVEAVKNRTLQMVDVYKSAKEDLMLVDKFYVYANNENFGNLINFNINSIYNACLKTKEKILEIIMPDQGMFDCVETVMMCIKNYAKNCNNLLGYLYFYNVFSV